MSWRRIDGFCGSRTEPRRAAVIAIIDTGKLLQRTDPGGSPESWSYDRERNRSSRSMYTVEFS